jgi:hypothetical protein|tara:strand:+ start:3129 stop:3578 length:450 start_codon:yes stop_codon:yes gene_type:complete
MITDTIKATGKLNIVLTGPDGKVKENVLTENIVVTVGKNFIASRLSGTTTPTVMSHMAVGTDATTAAVGNTALGAEIGASRVTLTSDIASTNNVAYVAQFPNGTGTGAITEAGIFDAGAAGTMLARTDFPVVNKGVDDSLSITWTITIN